MIRIPDRSRRGFTPSGIWMLDETTRLQLDKNYSGARGETGVDPSETDQLCLALSVHPFELGLGMLFHLESR
jgi:hypothetical protein